MNQQTYKLIQVRVALVAAIAATSACGSVDPANMPPTAVITVTANGQPVVANAPIPFMDQPVTITLDGSKSTDVDGSIVAYVWRRTDVSAAMRFDIKPPGAGGAPAAGSGGAPAAGSGGAPAAGDEDGGVDGTGGMMAMPAPMPTMMPAAAPPPAFMGDPPGGMTTQVELTQKGKYRYSLWVKDNKGVYSAAASFVVKLGGFAPDMACMGLYTNPKVDCRDCSCSPDAMGGCLDETKNCLANPDPMFKMLCTAVVNCAIMKNCTGSACFTGGCMAEITAAAMYMGGALPASCDPGMAAMNPCGASAALSGCQASAMHTCADVCK